MTKTDNDLIHIGKPIPFDTDEFLQQLENLAVVAYGNDPDIRSYGILTSLKIMEVMMARKKKLSELAEGFTVYPQVLTNRIVSLQY